MKKYLVNAALGLFSVLLACCVLEAGVRGYLYDKYSRAKFPMTVTHQVLAHNPGDAHLAWMFPSASARYWKVDENAHVVFKTEYYSNNLGLIARHPQALARSGKEYRIVVIGDSFTAALQMPTPWTDLLTNMLNRDKELRDRFGNAHFEVFNFGQPAGGFKDFKRLAASAKKVDPDLVVINYIEADFPRCNDCFTSVDDQEDKPKLVSGYIPIPFPGEAEAPRLHMTCEGPPVSFDNPTCRHSFSLEAPPSIVEDLRKLTQLKKLIVQEFLRGQLFFSWRSYALKMARGERISLTDLRQPDRKEPRKPREVKKLSIEEQLAQASSMIEMARSDFKRVLVTRHPVFEDLSSDKNRTMTDALLAYDKNLSVIDMREYLPADAPEKERYSWFCLPHDGHMSQKGGDVYARAMYVMIKNLLLDQPHGK